MFRIPLRTYHVKVRMNMIAQMQEGPAGSQFRAERFSVRLFNFICDCVVTSINGTVMLDDVEVMILAGIVIATNYALD